MPREVYLTFDVEDTINDSSILTLKKILDLLKQKKLRGIFFITGDLAEKLSSFKDVVSALKEHEIGYHSSSHSVRPIIAEYTDVQDYQEALRVSLKRETSHINPLTGELEGKGGILALKELFPHKRVVSFRAPGFSWSPPHLEALKTLEIEYDFSAAISSKKVSHKGITFFPYPLEIMPPEGRPLNFSMYRLLLYRIFSRRTVVIVMHPHSLINAEPWDAVYWRKNPRKLVECLKKTDDQITKCFSDFRGFLRSLNILRKSGMITVSPPLKPANSVHINEQMLSETYKRAIAWYSQFFNHHPRYLLRHFAVFFDYE